MSLEFSRWQIGLAQRVHVTTLAKNLGFVKLAKQGRIPCYVSAIDCPIS
jgi:hypothetical protein